MQHHPEEKVSRADLSAVSSAVALAKAEASAKADQARINGALSKGPTSPDGKAKSSTVPYLIKMAGQSQGLQCDTQFSAILTGKLILACLSGELSRPEQVAGWLDAHRSEYLIR